METALPMKNRPREIPLDFPGLLDLKTKTTPNEYARFLRSFGKLRYWPMNDVWVTADYDLGKAILKSPDFSADRGAFFISRMPDMDLSLIQDFFGVVQKMMVMSDAQEHTQRRRSVSLGLNDDLLEKCRPIITATVTDLLSGLRERGRAEFVSEIALQLPSRILADLFCIPDEDRPEFYRCSNNMTQFFGGASDYQNKDGIEVNASALFLKNYFQRMILARRADPKDDFLSILVRTQAELGLTDDEIVAQAVMMLVAGSVTTTDQLCNNLYTLLAEPGVFSDLRANMHLLPVALEEFNRLDPGVSYLFRVAKRDLILEGQTIREGETIFISNHGANREPSYFANPETCDIRRTQNPHFAYGHGPHFCIGARLARIQMMTLFRALLTEFPHLALDSQMPAVRRHYSLAFSGFESLPILVKA